MKNFMLFALAFMGLLISSCNTIAGVGDDITAGGKAINKAAVKTEQSLNQ